MQLQTVIFLVVWLTLSFLAQADDRYDVYTEVKIEMDDGVKLNATIWAPRSDKPLPTVLVATPYAAIFTQDRAKLLVQNDYIFIVIDVRGRGGSEGVFIPLEESGNDIAEVARWIRTQAWSNGKIGMAGISYNAMLLWKAVKAGVKIDTYLPTSPVYPGIDFPKVNNIFMNYTRQWLSSTHGSQYNYWAAYNDEYWHEEFSETYKGLLSFRQAGAEGIFDRKTYRKWLDHPSHDSYWQSMNPSTANYQKLSVPVLTTTGYFDSDQKGSLRYYREHLKARSNNPSIEHYLIIGPWDHNATYKTTNKLGGVTFGQNSIIDMPQLQIDWLDWVLKGKDKPSFLKGKVNYFVMGKNQWETADALNAILVKNQRYYLSSPNGNPSDVFQSGRLEKQPKIEPFDQFIYDPQSNANLKELEDPLTTGKNGYVLTQKSAFKNNALIYHTRPLNHGLTVSGVFKFQAVMSMNVDDTDLYAEVSVVMPEGTVHYLGNDRIRARYRNGLDRIDYPEKHNKETYIFNGFNWQSRYLPAGSRIRLVISASDSTNWQRNYNLKGDISRMTSKGAKKATIQLYPNESFLEVPQDIAVRQ